MERSDRLQSTNESILAQSSCTISRQGGLNGHRNCSAAVEKRERAYGKRGRATERTYRRAQWRLVRKTYRCETFSCSAGEDRGAAQRARWAKVRGAQNGASTPNRTMSAAARAVENAGWNAWCSHCILA